MRLTGGSFRLSIAALIKAFVTAAAHEPIYPKTCSDLIAVTGTTPIVAGSGTGAYHGIRGSFPVTLTLNEVEARPCQPSPGAFRTQLITVAGSGTISFRGHRNRHHEQVRQPGIRAAGRPVPVAWLCRRPQDRGHHPSGEEL